MYHYLQGTISEKTATQLVLDVGGVGYAIGIPLSTFEALPPMGQTVKILTYFVVREDAQALYGFLTQAERDLFKLLISVSGIGPKSAMTILSSVSIEDLKKAIVEGELETLHGIAGIGKKTAERLVVELREKIVLHSQDRNGEAGSSLKSSQALVEDSVEALVALGYRKQNAKVAVEKVFKNEKPEKVSVEELIRASLKYI